MNTKTLFFYDVRGDGFFTTHSLVNMHDGEDIHTVQYNRKYRKLIDGKFVEITLRNGVFFCDNIMYFSIEMLYKSLSFEPEHLRDYMSHSVVIKNEKEFEEIIGYNNGN